MLESHCCWSFPSRGKLLIGFLSSSPGCVSCEEVVLLFYCQLLVPGCVSCEEVLLIFLMSSLFDNRL